MAPVWRNVRHLGDTMYDSAKRIVVGLCLVCASACWADSQKSAGSNDYRIEQLNPIQIAIASLGLTDCTDVVALSADRALAACRSKKLDTQDNYGLRIYVLATGGGKLRVLSVSKGLGDAYSVKLQKRSDQLARYKDLIFADASAEYAYGTAVYWLNGDELRALGEIGHVLMDRDGNPVSALASTKVQATSDGFKVTFSQDVFALDKKGEYHRLDAHKTSMMFDGKSLR
jgi:hypothetical protein